jgi:UDP-N-acetylglucosamine--N-acetylmuramyl-(pentapeptide) pyrophosphoryl-undecaprenol N-acetylglucosamine transferase
MREPRTRRQRPAGALVVLAGGGTGGHLLPGIGLAEALTQREIGTRVVFYCTGRPLEERLLGPDRFARRTLPALPLPRGLRGLPGWVLRQARALLRAWGQVGSDRPDVVVGLGGYGAAAPVVAAWMRGIPTVLLEQNVIPGKATRFLSLLANEIHLQWEEARSHFREQASLRCTGSPLRRDLSRSGATREGYSRLGLDPARLTLLVTGGSQGARSLNEHVLAAVEVLDGDLRRRLQVLHLAGTAIPLDLIERQYQDLGLPSLVLDFLDDMPSAYGVADLVVSRAGGTTLAELAAAGLPAVLLPYPHAADRHQHANAEAFARRGAGVVLDEGGLTSARLAREVEAILQDPVRRHEMARAASALARPRARGSIAEHIVRLAHGGAR